MSRHVSSYDVVPNGSNSTGGPSRPRVEHRQNVGMRQIRGNRDPAQEPIRHRLLWSQHVHREPAFVFDVVGEVDRSHAAFAKVAFDPVAVSQGGREPGGDFGHI